MVTPILAQNGAGPLPSFHWAIVGPGMNLEFASSFDATVSKNLMRPPALEIAAPPHAQALDVRKFQRAIDPAAATPFWRANVPIGMVVERNNNDRLRNSPNPKRAQMMKVARTVKQE